MTIFWYIFQQYRTTLSGLKNGDKTLTFLPPIGSSLLRESAGSVNLQLSIGPEVEEGLASLMKFQLVLTAA